MLPANDDGYEPARHCDCPVVNPHVTSDTLEKQRIAYVKSKKRIEKDRSNIESHIEVQTYLKNNKIKCIKYHYALEKEVQK